MPRQAGSARARFVDGAPSLETIINGVPQDIGLAYLQLNGSTVASSFAYGTFTPFMPVPAGTHSLTARDEVGYAVGPLKTSSLTGGNFYTLVVVGSFPNYRVLTFQEPKSSSGAQLSFYEASPAVPSADFGSFRAIPEFAQHHFHGLSVPGTSEWVVPNPTRRRVRVERHNLLDPPPILRVDILICRNTLIYFTTEARQRVLQAMQHALIPGGVLILGPADDASCVAGLELWGANAPFIFRKVEN